MNHKHSHIYNHFFFFKNDKRFEQTNMFLMFAICTQCEAANSEFVPK